jgi:HEPN/RES N-terminal domain 1
LRSNGLIEQQEQGWDFTDKSVCARCIDDDALKTVLTAAEDADQSYDFCDRRPAAPLDVLLGAFVNGLRNGYGDADEEGVSWDGREGGYQWWGPT